MADRLNLAGVLETSAKDGSIDEINDVFLIAAV